MDFAELALIGAVGLLGPLLATPPRWRIPVVIGELAGGVALGASGFDVIDATDPTLTFLAQIGFALVMFVAGTHVPVRDVRMREALRVGLVRAVAVGLVATGLGWLISRVWDIGHPALYAVLMASSSAALVLPTLDSLRLKGRAAIELVPQVAVADAVCIVALPLALDPAHAGRAALGAMAVLAAAGVVTVVLLWLDRVGVRKRVHRLSEIRLFATELRIQLVILALLAALAVETHVSIMLAGFALGIGVNVVGEPRRLANQLFALTEGFLGPLFFVWLGASLSLGDLGRHPSMVWLGVALGLGAVATHVLPAVWGQPVGYGVLASAQLGVPSAAVAIGASTGVLAPGEDTALILGALITVAAALIGARLIGPSVLTARAVVRRPGGPD